MSANDVDRLLTTWLASDAGADAPEGLLERVLERTARTRRRPGWLIPERWIPMQLSLRWQPVPRAVPVLLLLALLIVTALIALAVGSAPRTLPPPFGPANNGRIAYVSDGQLWTVAPDGSSPRALSSGPGIKGIPIWSRDGTKIAYLAYKDPSAKGVASLLVANADGSNPVVVVRDLEVLQYFSWSRDGRSIAFSSWITYDGQRDRIFLAPSDGSVQPRQVGRPDMSAYDPALSPEGTRVLFRSDLNAEGFALQIMNTDGSDLRKLSGPVIEIGGQTESGTRGFDWSPDGTRILFGGSEAGADSRDDLYVVAPDGSSPPQRITTDPSDEFAATWSPTGDRIVFLRQGPSLEAVVANADGGDQRVLATKVASVSPQWSPDGRSVIVLNEGAGTDRTFSIIRLDGGGPPIVVHMKLPDSFTTGAPGLDTVGWQRIA